jgi:hypothetical protein
MGAFRKGDPRRAGPVEVSLGSRWVDQPTEPPWRLAWCEATGEVVMVQWTAAGDGRVVLVGRCDAQQRLEQALRDWWHMCGHHGSLAWVVRRLDQAGLADSAEWPPT